MTENSINLPIKKTTGDTVEERLTENAYERILPSRYLRKNENGELIETPEEMFERVAKNIALADVVYEANRQDKNILVTPSQVKNNHSKREKLVKKVFGEEIIPEKAEEKDLKTKLTEKNVKYFSYDNIIPELPSDVRNHVKKVRRNFEHMMKNLKFIPNSPALMNAGDELQQMSACFVFSPEDDMEDIHDKAKQAALVFQSGGGTGYGFWKLRPRGDKVGNSRGVASGPLSFMRVYDEVCATVAQAGKRRGAQMGVMRVTHPDIIEFIHSKNKDVSLTYQLLLNDPDDHTHNSFSEALEEARELLDRNNGKVPEHLRNAVEGHLSNFNISVGVTDDFMEAVKNNEMYTFENPRTGEEFIANEQTEEIYEVFGLGEYVQEGEVLEVPAREIWDRIIEGAHENGEPGVVFLERMNKETAFDIDKHEDKRVYATNPCGEQELLEYDACNLSHINLSTILDENCNIQDYRVFENKFDKEEKENLETYVTEFLHDVIDWEELVKRIYWNTRFLDNVVTMSDFPEDKIEETTRTHRKIGLGIMGYAQMLIQMGVQYGSEEGNEIARQLMNYINEKTIKISKQLAVEDKPGMNRGVFEEWDKSKFSDPTEYKDWFESETGQKAENWEEGFPTRNHSHTTIAPTGTTSQIGDTSGGCEPIYSVAYFKNVGQDIQGEEMLVEFDDYFLRFLEENNIDVEKVKQEAINQMKNNEFNGIEGLSNVPDEIAELFVTTSDLSPIEHADTQCAFQEGVSSSISKTINAPNEANLSDAKEAFMRVYDKGGKGVTYYRDGARNKQVKTIRQKNKQFADGKVKDEDVLNIVEEKINNENFRKEILDVISNSTDNEKKLVRNFLDKLSLDLDLDKNKTLDLKEYRKRPNNLIGGTFRITTGHGSLYVTLNEDENGELFEVFCEIGKSGSFIKSHTESLGRMVSLALRYGVPPERIKNHLEGIKTDRIVWDEGDKVESIPDAVALALERYLEKGGIIEMLKAQRKGTLNLNTQQETQETQETTNTYNNYLDEPCPECGEMMMVEEEGCKDCKNCGFSKCG